MLLYVVVEMAAGGGGDVDEILVAEDDIDEGDGEDGSS